jgi:hypothetical protein
MAALGGVACPAAPDNGGGGIILHPPHPRHQRGKSSSAGPDSGSCRAGVAGVFIAREIGQGGTHTYGAVPIETDNDAGQGAERAFKAGAAPRTSPEKPCGMHRRTYLRLRERTEAAEAIVFGLWGIERRNRKNARSAARNPQLGGRKLQRDLLATPVVFFRGSAGLKDIP